jgi:hypothetical protein
MPEQHKRNVSEEKPPSPKLVNAWKNSDSKKTHGIKYPLKLRSGVAKEDNDLIPKNFKLTFRPTFAGLQAPKLVQWHGGFTLSAFKALYSIQKLFKRYVDQDSNAQQPNKCQRAHSLVAQGETSDDGRQRARGSTNEVPASDGAILSISSESAS